jgi:hypothetical protein
MRIEWAEYVVPHCERTGIDCWKQYARMKRTEHLLLLASAIPAKELEDAVGVTGSSFETLSTMFVYMFRLSGELISPITEGLQLYHGAMLA